MFCVYCGKELEANSVFCSHCGKKIGNIIKPKQDVKGKVFSFVGFGLGIISFVFSLIPFFCFYSLFISIPGLIFSNLGKKSIKANYARKGIVFSILGLVIGVLLSILILFILQI